MIQTCIREEAQGGPRISENFRGELHYYFQDPGGPRPSPQAFLVQQDPNIVLAPHYHRQHQFQVVAHGSGTIGQHPLAPFAVHYASAETPYGPIISGDEGLWYFTIRAVTDSGAHFMPAARASMREGLQKSQATSDAPLLSDPAALMSLGAPSVEAVIEPRDDGVAAWLVRLPPGAKLPRPASASSGGSFYVVAQGSLQLGGREVPRLSVAFASADEEDVVLGAGAAGLEVIALQFPEAALTN